MKTPIIAAAAAALSISLFGFRAFMTAEGIANAESLPVPPAQQLVQPSQPLGCANAVLCVGDCQPGDAACVTECQGAVAKPAERLYHALVSCGELHECKGDSLCARKHCGVELNACLGAGAPEGGCK